MRHREHPLPHGDVGRQHVIDQVGGALGHPPAAAARAEAATLTSVDTQNRPVIDT
jgi:ribulose 1,5-bisphosphate carboxylase large subunit-like protein